MILVDSRHGSGAGIAHHNLVPALKHAGVAAESTYLESGDCLFTGEGPDGPLLIGVELKTVDDFLASMESSRLEKQLRAMVEYGYDRIYVVIIGTVRESFGGVIEVMRRNKGGRVYWQAPHGSVQSAAGVYGFMVSAEEFYGARFTWAGEDHEAVRAIVTTYKWWMKPWDEHSAGKLLEGTPPQTGIKFGRPSFRAECAALVPGFGWDRAKAADLGLGDMTEATEKDWAKLPRVGKKLAAEAAKRFQSLRGKEGGDAGETK